MDFKSSPVVYLIAGIVILFVLGQSIFFLVKAMKRAKEIGITKETLRTVITSSAVFTVPSAFSILATVISLAGALGMVVPWIRLSVIGNLTYESTAAEAAMNALGHVGGMAVEVTDKTVFAGVIWIMTFGIILPLILSPFLAKPILNKINGTGKKKKAEESAEQAPTEGKKKKSNLSGLMDYLSPAVFIGLIGAFVARAIAGAGKPEIFGDGAGVLSVITLVSAILISVVLELVCKKFKLSKLEPFVMPIGMIAAMGIAILMFNVLPADIAMLEWRG